MVMDRKEHTRLLAQCLVNALNAARFDDRVTVTVDMRFADCLEAGIAPAELANAVWGSIGEDPSVEIHPEMTMVEAAGALIEAGHEAMA